MTLKCIICGTDCSSFGDFSKFIICKDCIDNKFHVCKYSVKLEDGKFGCKSINGFKGAPWDAPCYGRTQLCGDFVLRSDLPTQNNCIHEKKDGVFICNLIQKDLEKYKQLGVIGHDRPCKCNSSKSCFNFKEPIENLTECQACGYKEEYKDKNANYCRNCGTNLIPPKPKEPFKLKKPNLHSVPREEVKFDNELMGFPSYKDTYLRKCNTCQSLKNPFFFNGNNERTYCKDYNNYNIIELDNVCDDWHNDKLINCPNCKHLVKKQYKCPVCKEIIKG